MILAAACLVLATASVTIQTTPQRVERAQEWRWCVDLEGGAFIRRTVLRVDGRDTSPTDETLITIKETDARFVGVGQ